MKQALIVEEKVYEGIMDYAHGGGSTIKRLIIEGENNLAITPHGDQLYAFAEYDLKRGKIIGKIEVPDELVEKALNFVKSQEEFYKIKEEVETLLK